MSRAEYMREWRALNPDTTRRNHTAREWYKRNKERLRPKKLEASRRYYENNRDLCIHRQRKYRQQQRQDFITMLGTTIDEELLPPKIIQTYKKTQEPSFKAEQGAFMITF